MNSKSLSPNDAIEQLAQSVRRIDDCEVKSVEKSIYGRILSDSITADRDSPAADISAMDGYAINIRDLQVQRDIPILGESKAGSEPPEIIPGTAVRIFTGAIVPGSANIVIKREDTLEFDETIQIKPTEMNYFEGMNIRRAGENARKGSSVLSAGSIINAANAATLANFGCEMVSVVKRLRLSIITTGDEVGQFEQSTPQPWQIRNSNLLSLKVLFDGHRWIEIVDEKHCGDQQDIIRNAIQQALDTSDAVILTGGVSVGDYDYVPKIVRSLDASITFHGLPIRPGKPILGASTVDGKLILGLPGNPVSAVTGCQRIGMPLLKYMAGFSHWDQSPTKTPVENVDTKTIPLFWLRLVKESNNGNLTLCQNQGSGDLVALGKSSGFIEVPPNENSNGLWPYYKWG